MIRDHFALPKHLSLVHLSFLAALCYSLGHVSLSQQDDVYPSWPVGWNAGWFVCVSEDPGTGDSVGR